MVLEETHRKKNIHEQQHFYSLDIIRGFAALSIVFFHWKFFFYTGTLPGNLIAASQPFYSFFFPFYERGWLAVDLFFCLSGFVMYWLYSGHINNRLISAWNFSVLRFSRLYPLHFVTLLIVLIFQQYMFYRTGDFFVFPANDIYHFVLNIFLASNWGFQKDNSFNAPIWTVSIEILVYLIFFIACRILPVRNSVLLLFVTLGWILMTFAPDYSQQRIGTGVFFFFIGGLVYLIYLEIIRKNLTKKWKHLTVVTIFAWSVAVLDSKYDFMGPMPLKFLQSLLVYNGHDYAPFFVKMIFDSFFYGFLFGITILTLVVVETRREHLGKRISFIGDISYSSYLLHFPLILLFMILAGLAGMDAPFFYNKYSLLIFFIVLIVLSLMSFRFLERPAKKILRDKLLKIDKKEKI